MLVIVQGNGAHHSDNPTSQMGRSTTTGYSSFDTFLCCLVAIKQQSGSYWNSMLKSELFAHQFLYWLLCVPPVLREICLWGDDPHHTIQAMKPCIGIANCSFIHVSWWFCRSDCPVSAQDGPIPPAWAALVVSSTQSIVWRHYRLCQMVLLEPYQTGTYVRTRYLRFPLSRVPPLQRRAYLLTSESQ